MRRHGITVVLGGLLLGSTCTGFAYEGRAVTDGGSIVGSVRVIGEVPTLPPQPVYKQSETCGETVRDERLTAGPNGALMNAVVFLDGVDSGKPIALDTPVTIDNLKCAFVPHVASATVGQTLEFRNLDPFLHDAHAWLGRRTLFNVALPKGKTVDQRLGDPGIVHINCNVRHTWMHAYLYVGENPYHAVTDGKGAFAIADVPPGTYTLTAWHELLGTVDRQVTVESGKPSRVEIEMPAAAAEPH